MSGEFSVRAPAKINLGLRVLAKRSDGFHGIESIFVTVGLCDELIVRPTAEKNSCAVFCAQNEVPQDNTITQAYRAARSVLQRDLPGLNVELVKGIPLGGGLGGGSSDAASLVWALQKCGVAISDDEAFKVAALVGSDVFFFLKCREPGSAALVSGRGEVVQPISPRCDLHYVLVFPGVHSSSAEAYAMLDRAAGMNDNDKGCTLGQLEQVYRKPVRQWSFANDFTSVVSGKYASIKHALTDVKDSGALFYDMSGSGSTVFGVYEDHAQAQKAFGFLSGKWHVALA